MRNKLTDLNDHLFAELERLSDEELTDEQLTTELKRADAISKIGTQIISNGHLALRTAQLKAEYGSDVSVPLLQEVVNEEAVQH